MEILPIHIERFLDNARDFEGESLGFLMKMIMAGALHDTWSAHDDIAFLGDMPDFGVTDYERVKAELIEGGAIVKRGERLYLTLWVLDKLGVAADPCEAEGRAQ